MSREEFVYRVCPQCEGMRGRTESPLGGLPEFVPCRPCRGTGFVPLGMTEEQFDEALVKSAVLDRLLRALIRRHSASPGTWVLSFPGLAFGRRLHPSFEAARDAIYEALGLGAGAQR